MQEQKYLEDINEKDKYINNLYKMSMSRGEILTYQLLREIKQELILANMINDSEMLILNNIFIPYLDQQQKTVRQIRSEEHTSELQSRGHLVCRLLLEKKKQ